jgi:hypothetical protein
MLEVDDGMFWVEDEAAVRSEARVEAGGVLQGRG